MCFCFQTCECPRSPWVAICHNKIFYAFAESVDDARTLDSISQSLASKSEPRDIFMLVSSACAGNGLLALPELWPWQRGLMRAPVGRHHHCHSQSTSSSRRVFRVSAAAAANSRTSHSQPRARTLKCFFRLSPIWTSSSARMKIDCGNLVKCII